MPAEIEMIAAMNSRLNPMPEETLESRAGVNRPPARHTARLSPVNTTTIPNDTQMRDRVATG